MASTAYDDAGVRLNLVLSMSFGGNTRYSARDRGKGGVSSKREAYETLARISLSRFWDTGLVDTGRGSVSFFLLVSPGIDAKCVT